MSFALITPELIALIIREIDRGQDTREVAKRVNLSTSVVRRLYFQYGKAVR